VNDVVDKPLYVRFATYLSYALTDIGDLAGAQQALAGALAHAEDLSDRYTEIRLYWSLARLYGVQGPPELTLAYYRRAISLLEETEDRFYLARAHEACGSALLDQRDPPGARAHLEAAEQIYEEQGQRPYIGSVRTELARLHLQSNELEPARRLALEALDLLDEGAGDPDDVGDAWRTLAEVFAEIGEHELATQAFETAIETLRKGAPVKYLGDAYRSYADFLHSVGRETEAFALLRQAVDLTISPAHDRLRSET
jgi:tetratricopeptide (TPR) repeat protein